MAGHHQRGRRRCPAQYQSGRPFARALHRCRLAQTYHRRCGTHRTVDAQRCRTLRRHADHLGRTAPNTAHSGALIATSNGLRGETLSTGEAPAADHRGSGALHLHLRNDRVAQSRQRQPCARHAMEPLVRRHDGRATVGPDVQLPADVSQRRRRAGAGRDAARRRLGGDSRKILGQPILERHRPLGLHAVSIHRRALPLLAPRRARPQ